MKKVFVFCTLEFESTHRWASCPIEEVSFLRFPHRHLFKVKCSKEVTHSDRDIEFIQLKRNVERFVKETYCPDAGLNSCEHMAHFILEKFELTSCEISEDGENGAVVVNV